MILHKNKDEFRNLIEDSFNYFGRKIPRFYIERDYYITKKIKELTDQTTNIALKGGIAMAKVYEKLPLRESKDIDFTAVDKSLQTLDQQKLNFDKNLAHVHCDPIKFQPLDGRKFNSGINISVTYNPDSSDVQIVPIISLVGLFMQENELVDEMNKYELVSFNTKVECPERIFVDKICALCDVYIKSTDGFLKNGKQEFKRFDGATRHLVDVYVLTKNANFGITPTKFKDIQRKLSKQIPHSFVIKSDYDFKKKLLEIAKSPILKDDFDKNIKDTIFDNTFKNNFEELKQNLIDIANGPIFTHK
ncbi:MAG: nucleotidyl transferase AbiEii/AbiGii toxin family protein [Mycoplasmataceae bacterium]|jgi:hypothetical protein|nr:nucleotidyl transferase AbiEii/AbiGii toxin family protein [Mycoplasmataceae bacterium]